MQGRRIRHSTPTKMASEYKRWKWVERLLRSDVDIWWDSARPPHIIGAKQQRNKRGHGQIQRIDSRSKWVHLPALSTRLLVLFPCMGEEKQQHREKTNMQEKESEGRVKWKEKLWGGFKNGHISNDQSKLRPTGLENRTHKFRTLNMFHCFLLPSLFSPSLSFISSAEKKKKKEHTHFTVGCHIF